MKRIITIGFVVLLVLFGGYIYVKILLDAGSDIKGDLSATPDNTATLMPTMDTAANDMDTVTMDTTTTTTTTTLPMIEEKVTIVAPPDQGLSVTGALGTGVEGRVLVGEAAEFGADVERVYCLVTVTGGDRPTEVAHVWYFKDQEKARTELPIKYKKHRTWSYKTIHPQHVGDWRVDVIDSSGNVLKSFAFLVR